MEIFSTVRLSQILMIWQFFVRHWTTSKVETQFINRSCCIKFLFIKLFYFFEISAYFKWKISRLKALNLFTFFILEIQILAPERNFWEFPSFLRYCGYYESIFSRLQHRNFANFCIKRILAIFGLFRKHQFCLKKLSWKIFFPRVAE